VFEQGKEEEDHGMIQQECKRLYWYVGSVEGGQGIQNQSGSLGKVEEWAYKE